MKTVRMEAVLA